MSLNLAIPLGLYALTKRYLSDSELVALSASVLYPTISSTVSIMRRRHLDMIGVLILLGIVTNAVNLLLGGNAKLLLIRGSSFTGMLGVVCFVSLLFPNTK